jgi:hypothetical protein
MSTPTYRRLTHLFDVALAVLLIGLVLFLSYLAHP